jgi:mono/diheme cytochrome c family protein
VIPRALAAALPLLLLAGCPAWDPMQRQGKYKAYQVSELHADGMAMRSPPAGTVPFGAAVDGPVLTGQGPDGLPLATSPVTPTAALLAIGQKQFGIRCALCHGLLGDGESQVALSMSLRKPTNLHLLRDVPDGYLYQVVSQGFGLMPSYAAELTPQERWAVVAYLRALQLSQHAAVQALPAPARARLEGEGR